MRMSFHNALQALPLSHEGVRGEEISPKGDSVPRREMTGRSLWASILILFAWMTGSASLYADDGLILKDVNLAPGKTTQVAIQLKNSASYTAFQLDITLPEGVTLVQTEGTKGLSLSSRASDNHSITVSSYDDGSIFVLVYSASNKPFSGTSGDILLMSLTIDENFVGPKDIEISNVLFTTTSIQEIKFPDVTAKCDILTATPGDVNDDGTVDISDYIGVANHILGNTPAGFNATAADVNNDGEIDISDYIGVANIILTGKP